jgi:hypothetical protein
MMAKDFEAPSFNSSIIWIFKKNRISRPAKYFFVSLTINEIFETNNLPNHLIDRLIDRLIG